MALPKVHRLTNRRDFKTVYERGIRRDSPHLVLRALLVKSDNNSGELAATQFGISISKKVSKRAVTRNLIKRQLKGAIRVLLPSVSSGWKIIIIVKSQAIECKYEHFLRELEQLLKEAAITNGH